MEGEVFYATPTVYPPHWAPFPELSSRLCWFANRGLPGLPRGQRLRIVQYFNNLIAHVNGRDLKEKIVRQIIGYIQQLRIDVLLICPQGRDMIDVTVAAELVEKTALPTVVWFMDNYYTDQSSISYVSKIWKMSQRRFVISEAMQQYFSEFYGGDCEMLHNSVLFPERYSEPVAKSDSRLRIVYAGNTHSYYLDSMSMVLKELHGLGDQLVLDIYSHNPISPDVQDRTDFSWRHFPPILAGDLIRRLQEYDVLLLLSSFKPEHRAIAETSLASKVADYLAAGRCILVYGPEYSENVRYAQRYGLGKVVTSQAPGRLREAILSLARHPECRRELGEQAYHFGRERHNQVTNRARLWQALFQAFESSGRLRDVK
jgi:hypothetical protein